jgi:hypothetical protein
MTPLEKYWAVLKDENARHEAALKEILDQLQRAQAVCPHEEGFNEHKMLDGREIKECKSCASLMM